jgi:hypothetical protein
VDATDIMKVITEIRAVEKYMKLAAEMMSAEEYYEFDFRPNWILQRGWKVVPVKNGNHFSDSEIDRIVPALHSAGYHHGIAVASEPMGLLPTCFELAMTPFDLQEFNEKCGRLRFLLTEETMSWAISCSEFYNLFAGEQFIVEAMLGMPIEEARKRFLAFAEPLAFGNPEHPLLNAARLYAAL